MLRKFFATSVAIVTIYFSAIAQTDTTTTTVTTEEVKPSPIITGSVDAYYRYNFGNPPLSFGFNNNTSFTNSQNSFELGMASIRADHSFGKASATIDLGFGRRAEEFAYGDEDYPTLFAIKQAYLSYAISDKFKLTIGKWATHIGYELVDAYLNRNYSMSYMFSYGPFSHTGLKADIGLGGKSNLMLGIANTTDIVSTTVSPKIIIGQFSTGSSDDKLKAYLNFQGGSRGDGSKLLQGDVVLTYAVSDKFSLGYNGTVQSNNFKNTSGDYGDGESWWGSALYLNLDPSSTFGLTLRTEYFSDKKSIIGFDASIIDVTLSPNIKIGNLTIIPELRLDAASNTLFLKGDGTETKSTVSGILAATYHF